MRDQNANGPTLTRAGFIEGARQVMPLLPGVIVFAAAFGTAATRTGMTLVEAILSSALVYAGASQLVALELWTGQWTLWSALAVILLTATVNARLILMGASLHAWIGALPGRVLWPSLFFLTDANWAIGERYRRGGGRDYGVVVGAGLLLWIVWVAGTAPGYWLGSLIDDPKRFAIDLVMPVFFAAMAVPLWRGLRNAGPWAVAATVSTLTWLVLPGYAFIITGALAGALTGAFLPVAGEDRTGDGPALEDDLP
jgi:predicted branched-subunit amino acid permease